jgi:environmental stress-induced protein Ves
MSLLGVSSLHAVPWKNGLGTTRELAVYPSGADTESFLWRISIADVTDAAPFSSFPGVDRSITLLEGAGFIMTLDGAREHALTTAYAPFAFPGEASIDVALAGGATRDFNLMLRRAGARGTVEVWAGAGHRHVPEDAVLLHCARGALRVEDTSLGAGDSWLVSTPVQDVALNDDAVVLAVRVTLLQG